MKLLITVLLILFTGAAFSQTHVETDKLLANLTRSYNNNDYKELYNQLSEAYKKDATEAYITSFYKNNLKAPLGQIINAVFSSKTDNTYQYLVSFEKGNCDFSFVFTEDQHINGMRWSPSAVVSIAQKVPRDPKTIKSNNPKQTKLQKYIDSAAIAFLKDDANSSLSIGIVNGGETAQYFYGETSKGSGNLPTRQSIYEIGSISKTFTAIMLAHAVNEGKLSLNDDIRNFLPGHYPNLEYQGKPVTVLQLANHTSGLPRLPADLGTRAGFNAADPYKGYTREMIYQYLTTFAPDTLSGYKAVYSNLGIGILGLLLENVYHEPLENILQNVITKPLKMNNTLFLPGPEQAKYKTTGYNKTEVPFWDMDNFKAAGGLKSNLQDMLSYLKANINDINADYKLAHRQTIQMRRYKCALAWMIKDVNARPITWHDGGTAGFTSYIGFNNEFGKGIVILNNSSNPVNQLGENILSAIQ
jgi:CubicO group peptidase (beta-lactamase class C family)